MKKTVFAWLVLVLFLFLPCVPQSVNEARSQGVTTGASGEARGANLHFSTQKASAVSAHAATGPQQETKEVGISAESRQREEEKDIESRAPKAPTGLTIIRGN